MNQVYYGVGWKRKFKAPTDFCFGVKHPQIQEQSILRFYYQIKIIKLIGFYDI